MNRILLSLLLLIIYWDWGLVGFYTFSILVVFTPKSVHILRPSYAYQTKKKNSHLALQQAVYEFQSKQKHKQHLTTNSQYFFVIATSGLPSVFVLINIYVFIALLTV
jgi:hypothetical protein